MRLDVAVGDGAFLVIGEPRRAAEIDAEAVVPRAGLGDVTGVDSERVASRAVQLRVPVEVRAAAAESDRADAVRAVHVIARRLVLVFERAVERVRPRDEAEVHAGPEAPAAGQAGPGLAGSDRAEPGGRDPARGGELVREVRADQPARLRVVVASVAADREWR